MVDDPYQAGPLPDPPADPDGIIRPAPHAHELASAAETERVVVASLIAGGEQYLTTWLHLTLRSYLAALRAVAARGLGLLASMTLTGLAEAQAAGRRPEVPNWVHRAIEASWATELDADVLTRAGSPSTTIGARRRWPPSPTPARRCISGPNRPSWAAS